MTLFSGSNRRFVTIAVAMKKRGREAAARGEGGMRFNNHGRD